VGKISNISAADPPSSFRTIPTLGVRVGSYRHISTVPFTSVHAGKYTTEDKLKQESLANAKVSAQQQCVYEGP